MVQKNKPTVNDSLRIDNIKAILDIIPFPALDEIFANVPEALRKLQVSQIQLVTNGTKNLNIISSSHKLNGSLTKEALGFFGTSLTYFHDQFETIQKEYPNTLLEEAIKNILEKFHEITLKIYLPRVILDYTCLYESIKLSNSGLTSETIFEEKKGCRDTLNYYEAFEQAYRRKLGFSTIFGDENKLAVYNITEKLIKNFNLTYKKDYLNIIYSIEGFYKVASNKNAAETLTSNLKFLANNYFSTLLKLSVSENTEKAKNESTEALKVFLTNSCKEIKNYKDEHPEELTQTTTILDKLLWLISKLEKLAPFISKETTSRTFWHKPTKTTLGLDSIEATTNKVATIAPAA